MKPNPLQAPLAAGETVVGAMTFEFFSLDRARNLGYNMRAIGTDTGLLAAATSELTAYAGRTGH
ncbi:MAG: hypothetical protein KGR68_11040 [Betaproteobacteria bacterium]|nr:hypothetical protein [Betaproteobacteria bacterium]